MTAASLDDIHISGLEPVLSYGGCMKLLDNCICVSLKLQLDLGSPRSIRTVYISDLAGNSRHCTVRLSYLQLSESFDSC